MIINLAGKGGVGKTTIAAILIDELARRNFPGKVLAIDGDPAMTLAMTLGLDSPPLTLAELRERMPLNTRQLKQLPVGVAPSQVLIERLTNQGGLARRQIRAMSFDLLVMGHGEGPGCYCRINQALRQALAAITTAYDVVILDNEAGLEHVSRYRLQQIDLLLLVLTLGRSSWKVAHHIQDLIDTLDLQIGQTWQIYNHVLKDGRKLVPGPQTILLPECETLAALDRQGGPVSILVDTHPLRLALAPLLEQITDKHPIESALEPFWPAGSPGA